MVGDNFRSKGKSNQHFQGYYNYNDETLSCVGTTQYDKNGNPIVRGQGFDSAAHVEEEEVESEDEGTVVKKEKVKVKRVLWDGTVQDDKWKDPNEIKILDGKDVERGVDPTG